MRRRALLETIGVSAALGTAGCLGMVAPVGNLGVTASESDCPNVADRIVCTPETDSESAPITLTAGEDSVSAPGTIAFTLDNGTISTLSTNYYSWRLWKRAAGEWHHLVPDVVPQPLARLKAGSRHRWELTVEHELPIDPGRDYSSWEDAGTVSGLGGGTYAFTTDGWFGDDPAETVGFGVLFEVDAPGLRLEPSARVTGSDRDGAVVTVHGEAPGESAGRAEFVLSRRDTAVEPRWLLPEVAAHDHRFRNTLPYFDTGVDRVRYVEENHTTGPPFGVQEPYTVSYRGDLFEVSAGELSSDSAASRQV